MNDERLERDLRAVLGEQAPESAPEALHAAVSRAPWRAAREPAGRAAPRPRLLRLAMALLTIGVLAAVVVVVATTRLAPSDEAGVGGGGRRGLMDARISWDTGIVALRARSAAVVLGGEQLLVTPSEVSVSSDPGNATYQTLEVTWRERGKEQRLNVYFSADATKWWASELRTYDAAAQPDWVYFRGPLFTTPLGVAFFGDVELTSVTRDGRTAVVRFEGMHLEAFRPGRVRLPQADCRAAAEPGSNADPLAAGEPLDDSRLLDMTPAEAARHLARRDLCVTWRYMYPTEPSGPHMYSEYWCDPPPNGRIIGAGFDTNGHLVIFVDTDEVRSVREQPPLGWGCED